MKVKLIVSRSGVAGTQNAGDEIEVSADEGKRMIEAGQASPVRSNDAKKEKTTLQKRGIEKASR